MVNPAHVQSIHVYQALFSSPLSCGESKKRTGYEVEAKASGTGPS